MHEKVRRAVNARQLVRVAAIRQPAHRAGRLAGALKIGAASAVAHGEQVKTVRLARVGSSNAAKSVFTFFSGARRPT